MKKYLIICLALLAAPLQGAHITDKLLAGLYEKPDTSGEPLKVLPSGTPVEVLEKKKGLSKVRTGDDTIGWIENSYITNEKPARVMLLELQAKTGPLQQRLREAESELKQLRAGQPAPDAPADADNGKALAEAKAQIEQLSQELAESNAALEQASSEAGAGDSALEQENQALRKRIEDAAAALGSPLPSQPSATAGNGNGYRFHPWHLLVLGVIILVSFISGIAYKNFRIAKRYGGFRI
ncbi:MAG: TIGR04211 family SH3 domain-containing protein [Sedimenticola sp.]